MKRILWISALILLLTALTAAACAAEPGAYENDAWRYTVTEDGAVRLDRYLGDSDSVTVPVVIDGAVVKELHYTFAGLPVRKVVLPAGMREIGEYAFCGCEQLENVAVSAPVTAFGTGCFYGCTALSGIPGTDPDTLRVGDYAFWHCTSLKELVFTQKELSFGECAFAFCSALEHVTFPQHAAIYVRDRAFTGVAADAAVLPGDTEYAPGCDRAVAAGNDFDHYDEENAFAWTTRDCMNGEYCVLRYDRPADEYPDRPADRPDGLRFGLDYGIYGTPAKARETAELYFDGPWVYRLLPDGNASVVNNTAPGIRSLKIPGVVGGRLVTAVELRQDELYGGIRKEIVESVTFPDAVTRISGFDNYSLLMEVSFPKGLKEIGDRAFRSAGLRGDLKIPSGVTLGKEAFAGVCVKRVILGKRITAIPDGCFRYCEYLTAVSLPDGLTEIGTEAFCSCEKLEKITLPSSVKRVGDGAFRNTGLKGAVSLRAGIEYGTDVYAYTWVKNVTVREGVTEIPDRTFCGCRKIKKISFPSTLLTIGESAFDSTADLKRVVIPANVRLVKKQAFAKGESLSYVGFEGVDTQLEKGIFYEWDKDGVPIRPYENDCGGEDAEKYAYLVHELTVGCYPDSTADRLYTRFVVKEYPSRYPTVTAPKDPVLTPDAVRGLGTVYSLVIPEGVERIENGALMGLSTLQQVKLPSTLREIGTYAFSDCEHLEEIKLPKGVVSIGAHAFENCRGLKKFVPQGNLSELGEAAFRGCTGMKTANLTGVKIAVIPASLFENCSGLKKILLPKTAVSVGDRAFAGCTGLENLRVPASVVQIGRDVTAGVKRSVTVETSGGSAFDQYWKSMR